MPPPAAATGPLPLPNCYWVLPGTLLAGEYPAAGTPEGTRARLARLRAAGVRCFVDLTEPGELEPYESLLPVDTDYFRRPIADHGLPESPAHMA
ncbi:MAG TPA: hypothetical protein VET66_10525, partial [Steroidobacteraceae bacterium]|nr:hypothetical protein [Steroidobacteraceae bacterium]